MSGSVSKWVEQDLVGGWIEVYWVGVVGGRDRGDKDRERGWG